MNPPSLIKERGKTSTSRVSIFDQKEKKKRKRGTCLSSPPDRDPKEEDPPRRAQL